ncbi:Zinc finger protein-like protein [Hapsidospora chrysogenum ATCC 11550]|uniref:Zinc finger protein-like protein n=1 Tax=Hapsidospora chrysogenum (strain ATCC 11550 / CBS 779.69 / DSM 880 / IAM 14645 / JCM 23072 / IMI 49137) TaxID=857340 RepID=A0A086TA41_HAPC1|nr:Zinc finger protein-like protein [Hapsidospora chrysogenum ATCC 11550]
MGDTIECPFCGPVPGTDEHGILLHMETSHPDDQDKAPPVPSSEANEHPVHGKGRGGDDPQRQEDGIPVLESPRSKKSSGRRDASKQTSPNRPRQQSSVVQAWREIFTGKKPRGSSKDKRRVRHRSKDSDGQTTEGSTAAKSQDGKAEPSSQAPSQRTSGSSKLSAAELGRYANEKRMPTWLVTLLEKDVAVCTTGIVPVLQQLLERCPSTRQAYLCSPCVDHISKLRREGSFCGYRNIQMLVSYMINSRSTGSELFGGTFPSIFQIQDFIEQAWDSGYNPQGRAETGGIKGTRKYIGTPEAQAMFCSLQIPQVPESSPFITPSTRTLTDSRCRGQAFRDKGGTKARSLLLEAVELYFRQGAGGDTSKVSLTALPPIYLQHQGHSLTIVGFERPKEGKPNLLIFSPSYRDSSIVRGLVGETAQMAGSKAAYLLEPYRRGNRYLRKYNEFELL